MKYKITDNNQPLYLQLYRQIRDDITSGAYAFNTKLPSKRLLSEELGISTVTVEHAYGLLCDEGYVESRERSGFFVIFQQVDGFVSCFERETAKVGAYYHNSKNYPDFSFSVLSKTIRNVLSKYGESMLEKSPNQGLVELRDAIRVYLLKNRGINVGVEQIVIGAGAEYLYGLIIELLGKDSVYGIEYPSYKKIEQVYRVSGVSYAHLPLSEDGIDSKALAETDANVLHTTPYRSYPTGVTASASKRYEYIRWSAKTNGFIIEDDFESEFSVASKPMDTLFALSDYDNVIYLNTFSKTVSSSLRVGYMVLPKSLTEKFLRELGFYSCTVSTFEQLVIAELINGGQFERHVNRVRRAIRSSLKSD